MILRRLSRVVWWCALALLLGALLLTTINTVLATGSDSQFINAINDRFPNIKIQYQNAKLRLSFANGLHVRAEEITVIHNAEPLLQAKQADFFLTNQTLHVALSSPQIHIPPLLNGGEGWTHDLLLSATDAQLTFTDMPLTLQSADINLRRDDRGWRFSLLEDTDFFLRANGMVSSQREGRVAVEFIGTPPLAQLPQQPIAMTLWADISKKSTLAATGVWQLASITTSFAMAGVYHHHGDWQLPKLYIRSVDDSLRLTAAAAGHKTQITLAGGVALLTNAAAETILPHLPADIRADATGWANNNYTANIVAGGLWQGNINQWQINNAHLLLFND